MRRIDEVPQRSSRDPSFPQVFDCRDVPQALRHLRPINLQEFSMAPEAAERLARRSFALCDLVFMMRKDEINPATVDVERFAQVLHRHRRALEVPARTAPSEGSVPRGASRL